MGKQTAELNDMERERQDLVTELTADHGPQWIEQYKPGSFGCHELLDRTACTVDMVERYVLNHPACVQNKEWFEIAERAASALRDLYQRVGEQHLGK